MRRHVLAFCLFVSSTACGGSEFELTQSFAFQQHALVCAKQGLAVRLERFEQGNELADCPLMLGADQTVQGTCDGFLAGNQYQLRLVYYTNLPAPASPQYLELATAVTFLNLESVDSSETVVTFDKIDRYPDDDGDGVPNIAEWCADTNPRGD